MKRARVIACAASLACVACSTPARAPLPTPPSVAAPVGKGIELADLDRAADPCTDFFQFATGGWRTAHPRPNGRGKWGRRLAGSEANRRELAATLDELVRTPGGSANERRVGDLYASCLDVAAADAAGIAPVSPWLDAITAARTPADIQRAIRKLADVGVQAPFGVVGAMSIRTPANYVASVVASGIGLPDRAYYTEPRHADVRQRYRGYIAHLLALAGTSEAQAGTDADAIVALETRLAAVSLAAAAASDPAATDHEMTFAELRQLAPSIDWDTYFTDAHMSRGAINVTEPAYLRGLDGELTTTPVAVWKAYLEWRLLDTAAPWLAKSFVDASAELHDRVVAQGEPKPRQARCLEATEQLLAEPVGAAYAAKHFPPAAKAKVAAIMRSLMRELDDALAPVTWMQPQTKAQAVIKLDATSIEVGYPDRAKDYASLAIPRGPAWTAIAAARAFGVADDRAKIGKPTPRDLWQLPPSSPDAYIEALLNQVVLPAGYLQPPIFDATATDAVNYGAIGVGVAHDLTHGIDPSGSEVDRLGRPINWWTNADREAFAARGRCVADQYAGYEIEPGVHLDGKRVLSEAIGDLAGIRIAYAAFQKSLATHPAPSVDGFTPEQQFFIAWAQFRGDDVSIEAQRRMVASDSHAVPRWRIDGTLANSPEFQRAFACKPGAAMVRPPDQRCVVW